MATIAISSLWPTAAKLRCSKSWKRSFLLITLISVSIDNWLYGIVSDVMTPGIALPHLSSNSALRGGLRDTSFCSFGGPCRRSVEAFMKAKSEIQREPGKNILNAYAPGVLLFGASYCGPCKALQRRLSGLGFSDGIDFHYFDAEDSEIDGGSAILSAALRGAPFLPPLPALVVLGTDSSGSDIQTLQVEAGEELMMLSDESLRGLLRNSNGRES
eukprot:TRINITY_DN12554_c0_g1_i1.p1 TRINITY_DN12554_c0_g1~~TRINITY_DN12554_c0_g1_i1.p1  ORF type:complete len:228 (+),score=25.95 TRINITY_DN12554_c0_g1_i1:40-684(+)